MRDLRDPGLCGLAYLKARQMGVPIGDAVTVPVQSYRDDGHISNDPAHHHSKTPQNLGSLDDGGT